MTSVAEASSTILDHLFVPVTETVPLAQAVGRILAEPVKADRDLPPFDRVTMDGIAIRASAFESGRRDFRIAATLAAGAPALALTDPETCIEIMTGAVLPEGADTIVKVEDVQVRNDVATVMSASVTPGEFIHRQGADAKAKQKLLDPGVKISPAEISLLATVGKSNVSVFKTPRIAVVSTGDELVNVSDSPLPHQIRQSNSHTLAAALEVLKCYYDLFHIEDNKEKIEASLRAIMTTHDVIILSGGVSRGKFDFVPDVLTNLGVQKLFHQVSQRPGKPFWFGVSDKHTVFALPGNPVSTFLCFLRYFRPWLQRSLGQAVIPQQAILAEDYVFKPALTYFLQVKIRYENGKAMAWPSTGGGSGDFANLKDVDGFLELPLARASFKAGQVFSFIPFR